MNRKLVAAIGTGIVAYGAWKRYRSGRQDSDRASGLTQAGGRDQVSEASFESFPASDPPAFGGVTGPRVGIDRRR